MIDPAFHETFIRPGNRPREWTSVDLTQRHLVNRRLRLADAELVTKYVFPFWDGGWRIAFYLVDRLGRPPVIMGPPIRETRDRDLASPLKISDLRGVESTEPGRFVELYHYDPWWVFRGMGGIPDPLRRAILPSNIARTFLLDGHEWKVYDVEAEADAERIHAIVAKDESFRRRDFTAADLNLSVTWPRK